MQRQRFEISFLDPVTHELRRRHIDEVAGVRFAEVPPIRRPPSYRGQRHMPGLYFFSKTGRHVVYESQSERMVLTLLDFDAEVAAVAAQPFALHLPGPRPRRHTPDFFVELVTGGARVVEVKAAGRSGNRRVRQVTEWAARACAVAGWDYLVATKPAPVFLANLLWLSGFRRPPFDPFGVEDQIRNVCQRPRTVAELDTEIGAAPFMRPILFHLLWKHELVIDMDEPLSNRTLVSPEGSRRA